MKTKFLLLLISVTIVPSLFAQTTTPNSSQRAEVTGLIDKYSQARENRDTVLLKSILTNDVDQLVSTGEWRDGIKGSVSGMLRSSATSPGTRTLTVEKIRFLDSRCAIVDARYEIKNTDGTIRKMWSTFVVVNGPGNWKISAIRNMLPGGQ